MERRRSRLAVRGVDVRPGSQQQLDGTETTKPNSSMQRRHAIFVFLVNANACLDQVFNDRRLDISGRRMSRARRQHATGQIPTLGRALTQRIKFQLECKSLYIVHLRRPKNEKPKALAQKRLKSQPRFRFANRFIKANRSPRLQSNSFATRHWPVNRFSMISELSEIRIRGLDRRPQVVRRHSRDSEYVFKPSQPSQLEPDAFRQLGGDLFGRKVDELTR